MYDAIDAIDEISCRPDFSVLCYSGYLKAKDKGRNWRRKFAFLLERRRYLLAHSTDDSISNAEHSVFMYLALKRAGIPTELHIYATGEHDFGVRQNDKLPSSWMNLCLKWLRSRDLLKGEQDE